MDLFFHIANGWVTSILSRSSSKLQKKGLQLGTQTGKSSAPSVLDLREKGRIWRLMSHSLVRLGEQCERMGYKNNLCEVNDVNFMNWLNRWTSDFDRFHPSCTSSVSSTLVSKKPNFRGHQDRSPCRFTSWTDRSGPVLLTIIFIDTLGISYCMCTMDLSALTSWNYNF